LRGEQCGTASVGSSGSCGSVISPSIQPCWARIPIVTTSRSSRSSRMRWTSQGSALSTSYRVPFAVRWPSGWYQGTTFQATSLSRASSASSRIRKKFAAVSSLLSAEIKLEPRADAARPDLGHFFRCPLASEHHGCAASPLDQLKTPACMLIHR